MVVVVVVTVVGGVGSRCGTENRCRWPSLPCNTRGSLSDGQHLDSVVGGVVNWLLGRLVGVDAWKVTI